MISLAFRRSLGRLFFPVVLVVEGIALFAHGTEWTALWTLSASHVAGGTIIVGPIAAACGCAAFVERVRRQATMPESASTRDSSLRFAAVMAWVMLAHFLAAATAYGVTVVAHGELGPYDLRLVLVSTLALIAYAAWGAVVGSAFPSWASVPAAAVAAYLLVFLVTDRMSLILVGGATGIGGMVGKTYSRGPLVVQGLWFAAVAAAGFSLLLMRHSRAAIGALALSVGLGVFAYTRPVPNDILQMRQPADIVCRERVCADREVGDGLPPAAAAVQPLLAASDRLASDVRDAPRVERIVTLYPFPEDSGTVATGWMDDAPHVDISSLAFSVAEHLAGCLPARTPVGAAGSEISAHTETVMRWLAAQTSVAQSAGPSPSYEDARRALAARRAECA